MRPLVIDTSVAIKWFIPEQGSDKAIQLLERKDPLIAPDLIHAEFANILWKLFNQKTLIADQAMQILTDFLAMPMEIYSSQSFIQMAFEIAAETGRTVYDSIFVALAAGTEGKLMTADKRLVNAMASTQWKSFLRLIE